MFYRDERECLNEERHLAEHESINSVIPCDGGGELDEGVLSEQEVIESIKDQINYFLKELEKRDDDRTKLALLMLYRMAKQFDEAIEFAKHITFKDKKKSDYYNSIIEYEVSLCKNKDAAIHHFPNKER